MSTERIDIVVTETGSRRVRRDLEDIGTGATKAQGGVDMLRAALLSLGVAVLANEYRELSDSFTQISNALQLSGLAGASTADEFEKLLKIANDTRQPIEAMAQLFTRGAMAANELGASQEDLLDFVGAVGTALATQGGSAEQASGALLQMAQALGAGTVRAEEFNSMIEGAYPVVLAAAKGIDEAGGSVARLRQLVVEGKVSSQEFFEAVRSQKDVLEEAFAKSAPTINGALTVLRNNLTAIVGEFNSTTGAASYVAQAILMVADNLGTIADAAATVALAFGPVGLVMALNAATAAFGVLTAAIAANPFGAAVVAVTGLVAAMYMFGDSIGVSADGLVTLRDYVVATFTFLRDAASTVVTYVAQLFRDMGTGLSEPFARIVPAAGDAFSDLLGLVQDTINTYVGVWVGAFNSVVGAWNGFPAAFGDLIRQAANAGIAAIEWFVNKAIEGINAVLGLLNQVGAASGYGSVAEPLGPAQLGRIENQYKGAAEQVAGIVKDSFSTALSQDYLGTAVKAVADDVSKRAEQVSKERIAAEQASAIPDLPPTPSMSPAGGGGGGGSKGKGKELASFAGEMRMLTQEIEAQKLAYDSLNSATSVAGELMRTEMKLRQDGVVLSGQERADLQGKLEELARLNQLTEAREAILDELFGGQQAFNTLQQAANDLLRDGTITAEQYAQAINRLGAEAAAAAGGPLNGLRAGLMRVSRDGTDMANDVADAVENAFGGMEDALVEFVKTGKLDFGKLVDSIITDLARLVIRYMVIQPIIQAITGAMGGFMGGMGGGSTTNLGFGYGTPGFDFATGGGMTVGGSGGVDSQMVPIIASPGERIQVYRPGQSQAQAPAGSSEVRLKVEIDNKASEDVTVSTRTAKDEDGLEKIIMIVERRVADGVGRRGSPINKALKSNFNLTDSLTRR